MNTGTGILIGYECDIGNLDSVISTFDWIECQYGGVNILVNNAGVLNCTMILAEENEDALNETIETYIQGFINCTKKVYQMLSKNDDYGHIININCVLGYKVANIGAILVNMYPGCKHAMIGLTEVLRQELNHLKKTKIKVTVSTMYILYNIYHTEIQLHLVKLTKLYLFQRALVQVVLKRIS